MLFAFMLPVVIGGAGFGVETSYWYFTRLSLQGAADAAAYSAAMERRGGSDDSTVASVATLVATQNGYSPAAGSIQVVQNDLTGGGSVQVTVNAKAQRFFTGVFNKNDLILTASAVGTYNSASNACILALDHGASKAANFSGSSDLKLNGCSVMANSTSSSAVNVQGAAKLQTDCVIAVGGVSATSGLTFTVCSTPITNAPQVADPFKNVPTPTPSGPCLTAPNNNGTMSPGRYCSGATLKGDVTLQPGVYYMEGDFNTNAGANVSGAGVTIYMQGSSRVTMNGSADVSLTAPASGTYSGILFFGDRTGSGSTINKFNGTATLHMTGAIYFASQNVQYNGNFSGLNGCTQVVADTVEWTGNTDVGIDCTAYGMKPIPALNVVRLTT